MPCVCEGVKGKVVAHVKSTDMSAESLRTQKFVSLPYYFQFCQSKMLSLHTNHAFMFCL